MVDFTRSLFMTWAPLSQGVLTGMRASPDLACC
jgi:hypothetical protein